MMYLWKTLFKLNSKRQGPIMERYLKRSAVIDWDDAEVLARARMLAAGEGGELAMAGRCFEFVRDEILHSHDHGRNPVTLRASEVLRHRTGYCYAKSHLLAALLRANGIPAGLCYQRLTLDEFQKPFCLHGLNAIYLREFGWYRVDARGLKPGLDARFDPPHERLAYVPSAAGEADLPEIWDDPAPCVVEALSRHRDYAELRRNLPDIELITSPAGTLRDIR
jgi:transglutaminase-like putative cysteine protease